MIHDAVRLVIVEASRESSSCLACVYLNEYKTAVAAFTLSAADPKTVKVKSLDAPESAILDEGLEASGGASFFCEFL